MHDSAETDGTGCSGSVAGLAPKIDSGGGAVEAGPALPPHLLEHVALVVGEQADAVRSAHHLVEVFEPELEREVAVDGLGDVERRLDGQRHLDDDAERTEPDDRPRQPIVAGVEAQQVSVGDDELDRSHGSGQVAVADAGSVSRRGDRPCHGDVWKRGQVVQRQTLAVQCRRQFAVSDPALHRDRASGAIDRDDAVETGHHDQIAIGVGDGREAVSAAGGVNSATVGCGRSDDLTDLVDARRSMHALCRERDVARPVAFPHGGNTTEREWVVSDDGTATDAGWRPAAARGRRLPPAAARQRA